MKQSSVKGISVVIPYYNDSPVFKRTLDSLSRQSLLPSEVIIVDDCSEDHQALKEIFSKFKYPFEIVLHRNEVNKNGAYSRNFGIKLARYDYIALLDADDFFGADHLKESMECIEREKSDFIYSNMIKKFENGKEVKIKVTDFGKLSNKNNILFHQPPQTNSFFFLKKKLEANGVYFDERLRRHQDWQFLIEILNSDLKVSYLDAYNSYYCESLKPFSSRVNYDSIFVFWSENRKYFSAFNLYRTYIKFLLDIYFNESIVSAEYYMDKYKMGEGVRSTMMAVFFMCGRDNKRFMRSVKFLYYILLSPSKIFQLIKYKFKINNWF